MDREVTDALNRLVAATGAAHEAARDLKDALAHEETHSAAPAPPGMKRYEIAEGEQPRRCKGCGATIFFATTVAGKYMPVNPDGTSHMDNCPHRHLLRKS